jgi:hypothetical protein
MSSIAHILPNRVVYVANVVSAYSGVYCSLPIPQASAYGNIHGYRRPKWLPAI